MGEMERNLKRKREDSCIQIARSEYRPQIPISIQGNVGVDFSSINPAPWDNFIESMYVIRESEIFSECRVSYSRQVAQFLNENANVLDGNRTPLSVGVVMLDEQCPGEDNVIWGLLDALKAHHTDSTLLGFSGGDLDKTFEITDQLLASKKNQNLCLLERTNLYGRDLVHYSWGQSFYTLDGFVVIGGLNSSYKARNLAESLVARRGYGGPSSTKVVSVPVTINGDFRNLFIETSVGFDTICKAISEAVSDICNDTLSKGKYYHFVKLEVGGKTSNIALMCALQSHPNMVILVEEVSKSELKLSDIANQICDAVQARAEQGISHGVILLPKGLLGSISEFSDLLHWTEKTDLESWPPLVKERLSKLFESLPNSIKEQLTSQRESTSTVDVSKLDLLIILPHVVRAELTRRLNKGTYKGKFECICTSLGREDRKSPPTKFDCDYAYALGHACCYTVAAGLNGYAATVQNLKNPINQWRCGAIPIVSSLVHVAEDPKDPPKMMLCYCIPTEVDLTANPYKLWEEMKKKCLMTDDYTNPAADEKTMILCAEDRGQYLDRIKQYMRENKEGWWRWGGFSIFHLDMEMLNYLSDWSIYLLYLLPDLRY